MPLGLARRACLVLSLLVAPVGAHAALISDLFGGDSLSNSRFVASDWQLLSDVSTVPIDFSQITVTLSPFAGDSGVQFVFDFDDQLVVSNGELIDIDFMYRLTDVSRPHFFWNALDLTDWAVPVNSGSIVVQEDVFCRDQLIAQKEVEIDPASGTEIIHDEAGYLCKDFLVIEKRIELLSVAGVQEPVRLVEMRQTFVPLPGTLALFGLGLLGMLPLRWRRGR